MKKLSFIIILFLIASVVVSCGDNKVENKDLNEDENITEEPKEEVDRDQNEQKDQEEQEEEEQEEQNEMEAEEGKNESDKDNTKKENQDYTKKEDKPKDPIASSNLKKIEDKGYATVDSLNVRNLGSMKGKIITSIDRGVEVHVFGERNSWYYVEYAKNKRGWIYSKYIQFNPVKPTPTDPSSLSNKSYNWYFMRNNNHKQPGFGNPHKALLDKYDGIAIGNKNKKDIFLTFDNGYENGYTSKILDILKRQNVKVGFFVQGTYIDSNPEIVKRMVREGHIVLNHTNSHPKMPTLSREKLQYEINLTAKKYKDLVGKDMLEFLRPPSGVFSERTLAQAKNLGYKSVFWSMAYRDWVVNDQPGKVEAYKHVTDNIHNGAVILLHSVSKSNTEALEDIIEELKRQGYNFKLLTQYP